MIAVQMEFPLKIQTEEEAKLDLMQKQLDAMNESMGKVRRKLFSEMGELKKLCYQLQTENENLKKIVEEGKNEKTEWIYAQEDSLFDVRECQESCI